MGDFKVGDRVRYRRKTFVAYFHFNDWHLLSLGMSVDLRSPNVEIHVPFGFVRIGWAGLRRHTRAHTFGFGLTDTERASERAYRLREQERTQ